MKKLAIVCLFIAACGDGTSTTEVTMTVAANATGKAVQPSAEVMPNMTVFSVTEASQSFTIDGADLAKLWPLMALVQAAPDTFGDALTVSASPTVAASTTVVFSTSASETDGCDFDLEQSPPKPPASCGKDLVKGLKLIPAPTSLDVKVTTDNAVSMGASFVSPSGAARTLVWGAQGTIAKLVPPAKTTITALASTTVAGTINIAPPPNATELTATVFLVVDFNADGLITTDEVTSGVVALDDDVDLSTIVTAAAAEKIITAAQAAELKYVMLAAVRSKGGNISGSAAMNGVAVSASLSFKSTATTKAVAN